MRACVSVCVRACVRACVCARARMCVCARARAYVRVSVSKYYINSSVRLISYINGIAQAA